MWLVKKEVKQQKFVLPCYEGTGTPLAEGGLVLSRFARSLQESVPDQVIHSAKSWLCHGGVSREDKILPWNSDELIGDARYSPVEVQSFLLMHLRLCWNHTR